MLQCFTYSLKLDTLSTELNSLAALRMVTQLQFTIDKGIRDAMLQGTVLATFVSCIFQFGRRLDLIADQCVRAADTSTRWLSLSITHSKKLVAGSVENHLLSTLIFVFYNARKNQKL